MTTGGGEKMGRRGVLLLNLYWLYSGWLSLLGKNGSDLASCFLVWLYWSPCLPSKITLNSSLHKEVKTDTGICVQGKIRFLAFFYTEANNKCYWCFDFLYLTVIMSFSEGVFKNLLDVSMCWDINISFLDFTNLQLWLYVK